MPRGKQSHIAFYVKDLDDTLEKWTKLLSILDPEMVKRKPVILESGEGELATRTATFINPHGLEFQFVSTRCFATDPNFKDYVDHICFVTPDIDEKFEELKAAGFRLTPNTLHDTEEATEITSADGILRGAEWARWFIVPMPGPVGIEVATPYQPINGEWQPVENWSRDERYGING